MGLPDIGNISLCGNALPPDCSSNYDEGNSGKRTKNYPVAGDLVIRFTCLEPQPLSHTCLIDEGFGEQPNGCRTEQRLRDDYRPNRRSVYFLSYHYTYRKRACECDGLHTIHGVRPEEVDGMVRYVFNRSLPLSIDH
ncbi:Dgri\GH19443-PA-like protein [Anopheles sinensis]|uniref:Dgri\GH19443-PA-like protein n=1 Tax=Anopheles sinensis TaxID=74873 RepID=A0A084VFL5_ANOSI|nr:Dgri\GH19443-PA-like protein [Anopheles sinensis]